jgi:predicted phosphodiesterase
MKRLLLILAAWTFQPLVCSAAVIAGIEAVPVYRFWSPVFGRHFYTFDEAEKAKLLSEYAAVWTYEGIAFRAYSSYADASLSPVYRFWSGSSGAHFYTLDEAEKDKLLRDYSGVWTYEGVAFYAHAAGRQPEGTMPASRFWSGHLRTHFYTTSDRERFKLVGSYAGIWDYENVGWYAYPAEQVLLAAFVKGPFVSQVTSDSATITWETDVAAQSTVYYGAGSAPETAVSDPVPVTLHKVVLTGLEAGVLYAYRATSGMTDQTGTFKAAPRAEQPFRFVVYGDTRSDPETHRRVTVSVAQSRPDIVFHTGDLVGAGRDYPGWDTEFFEPAGELILNRPFIPVPGNHEYSGGGPPWFFYFFNRPLGEGWFAMTYGNTRFVMLDTNVNYSAGSPQHNWLVQELQSGPYRNAAWHVIVFHHPPFTCTAGHSDDPAIQSQLVPLFEQHGVDVVFCGHSHAYERYLHNGIHYIVTGGGGAPLYPLAIDITPPIRLFGLSADHYCVADVDLSAGTLAIRALDLNGQIFDAVTLSKSP